MHEARITRHGDPFAVHPRGFKQGTRTAAIPSYSSTHKRLLAERGKPATCSRCGKTGRPRQFHWALDWTMRPVVLIDERIGCPFSPRIEDYVRLCVSCHKIMDLAR